MDLNLGTLDDFLRDIEPLFYGRRLTYIDVGAFDGETFKKFFESGLSIREAVLIEPNPDSFAKLKENLRDHPSAEKVDLLNLAVGAEPGELLMKAARSMTRVVSSEGAQAGHDGDPGEDGLFSVQCKTLTELSQRLTEKHISILKIDVEGFEKEVLQGCVELLENQTIDMIYVEAGMNPEGEQQLYYREIDDLMLAHGYRMFRIYEQMFEWIEDSPFLRRANLAYMSTSFASKHPFRLSTELFAMRKKLEQRSTEYKAARAELKESLHEKKAELKAAREELAAVAKDGEAALGKKDAALEERAAEIAKLAERLKQAEEAKRAALEEQATAARAKLADQEAKREAKLEALRAELDQAAAHSEDQAAELAAVRAQLERESRAKEAVQASKDMALQAKEAAMQALEERLRKRLTRAAAARKRLEGEFRKMQSEFREVRSSWGNRFGRALIDGTKSPRGLVGMPLKVAKLYTEYLKLKINGDLPEKKPAHLEDPVDVSGPPPAQKTKPDRKQEPTDPHWPKPMASCLVWQAAQLVEDVDHDSAISFLERYGKDQDKAAANLFRANADIDSDETWVRCFNAYLGQFDITPLALLPGAGNRFQRITAERPHEVPEGPLVSVIMPAFDSQGTIEHSVRSVLNQTWQPFELIIVDDASSDGTWDLIQHLARQDDRIKAVRNPANVGPYVSKNRGLGLARGRFVTGHDADDWAHPQRLEDHVTRMLEDQSIEASLGYMIRVDEQGGLSHFAKIGKTSLDGVLRLASISCMFQRETLRTVFGHWDSVRFSADSELIERARAVLGERFATFKILGMVCLDAEGSLTNDPVHGVSKQTGISDTRRYYRSQWKAWHGTLDRSNCYMDFPHEPRKYDAPSALLVDSPSLEQIVTATDADASGAGSDPADNLPPRIRPSGSSTR